MSLIISGYLPHHTRKELPIMCNNDIEPSDVIAQGTGLLLPLGRQDALGPTTKIQIQTSFMSNRTDRDFISKVTMHYVSVSF
jgi:hypothetical protein